MLRHPGEHCSGAHETRGAKSGGRRRRWVWFHRGLLPPQSTSSNFRCSLTIMNNRCEWPPIRGAASASPTRVASTARAVLAACPSLRCADRGRPPCALAAKAPAAGPTNIADLTLEQLMDLKVERVYGVSKHVQKVTQAPSSVSIVTAGEIQRFGWRTLSTCCAACAGSTRSTIATTGISACADSCGRAINNTRSSC